MTHDDLPTGHRAPRQRPRFRRGFTLIELVVVLAILVVVAAVGWGSLRSHLPRFRLVSAAKQLKGDLVYLRNLAITANRQTRLRLVSSGGDCASDTSAWGGSWSLEIGDRSSASTSWDVLPEDTLRDGTDDDQSRGSRDIGPDGQDSARFICLADWGSIEGPGTGNSDAIVFSPRGRVANPGTDFSTSSGWLSLSLVNQSAARQGLTDQIDVMVSRTGVVRLSSSASETGTGGGS